MPSSIVSRPAAPRLIGRFGAHARTFLLLFAGITTVVFALPIFLFPIEWAEAFAWEIPADTDLVLYFARAGAALLLVAEFLMLRAAITGNDLRRGYELLLLLLGSQVAIHIWGEIREAQPIAETLEIALYSLIFVVGLAFYPTGGGADERNVAHGAA